MRALSKATKKHNALKHGANAKEVMLWSESYEDYESVRVGLNQEWTPNGSTEEYLVQTLLDLRWRRQRLDRYGQISVQKRLDEIRDDNQTSRHIENLGAFAPEFNEADSVEKVETILSRLAPLYSDTIRLHWPFETGGDPAAWGPRIGKGLASWKPPTRHEGGDEFVEIIDLETFDEELARIERLDAMIDRTIKRLVQIKTMKQMYGRLEPKLINFSVIKDHARAPWRPHQASASHRGRRAFLRHSRAPRGARPEPGASRDPCAIPRLPSKSRT